MDFDAIAHEGLAALDEADRSSPLAAAFLRTRVPELIRAARRHDCRECDYQPADVPITRRHEHG